MIIKYGDIVTYEEDENFFVTHRIMKKYDNKLITKGDKNNEVDTEINKSQIVGKVVYHSLFWGIFIRKYLKFIFIGFTAFVIIVNIFRKNNREEDEKNGEREKEEKV